MATPEIIEKARMNRARYSLLVVLLAGCSSQGGVQQLPQNGSDTHVYYVATSGSDRNPGTLQRPFRTIRHGLAVADVPGDAVRVRAGTYLEGIDFPADGTPMRPIVLENYPGERPFISGRNESSQKLVRIFDRSHIRFTGFDVGDLEATSPLQSGAIFVEGYGNDVTVADTIVHDVRPKSHRYANGRAIQVRGFYADRALTGVSIENNVIERCVVQDGNVLEVSGNTSHVRVRGNRLVDNAGIALNVTGGTRPPLYERWDLQVSDVVVAHNEVSRTLGSGAVGIYIQASRNVLAENNEVSRSQWGVYVTSEYPGVHSREVTIEDNTISDNVEAGLLIGSPFFPTAVIGATVEHNTVVHNGAFEGGNGGNFGIGRARHVKVRHNRFVASDQHVLTYLGVPYTDVTLDDNCYDSRTHDAGRARFGYAAVQYVGFARYQAATHQDGSSTFGQSCD